MAEGGYEILKGVNVSPPPLSRWWRQICLQAARLRTARPLLYIARLLLRRFSDAQYLALGYLCYFGRWPDYRRPRNFNEHIHAYMLRKRDPLLKIVADKISVRYWLENQGAGEYLVPLLGIWESAEDVPLRTLNLPCVIKPSVGSGSVIFLQDRDFDEAALRAQMRRWLTKDYSRNHREWCYQGTTCRIVVEKMLTDSNGEVPSDYKAYAIGGKVRFIQIDKGRFSNHTRNLYSPDWQFLPVRLTLKNHACDPRPQSLETMLSIAENLARHFEFIRVDYYWIDGALYIGELTNYPGAGFERFIPHAFSRELAGFWNIEEPAVQKNGLC